ncbi:hypothetical protein ACFSCX_25520 [Bacillus salitolerans]|uniref:PH domain-containing protein n=1 Tax=Bacillus salitolerans TaxID=1437434 RepID=A0ABW4LY91_9BACI
MNEKVFTPKTTGVLSIMSMVYVIVLMAGTILNIYKDDGLENWFMFLKVSSLYILACSILFFAIKSQRIILNNDEITLKQLGLTRHKIQYRHIEQVRKGKMNGSPIMEIETRVNGCQKVSPMPFLPFETDWKDIIRKLQEECGKEVVGEMTIRRAKGELRTWKE